jgi:hypothetical protein
MRLICILFALFATAPAFAGDRAACSRLGAQDERLACLANRNNDDDTVSACTRLGASAERVSCLRGASGNDTVNACTRLGASAERIACLGNNLNDDDSVSECTRFGGSDERIACLSAGFGPG